MKKLLQGTFFVIFITVLMNCQFVQASTTAEEGERSSQTIGDYYSAVKTKKDNTAVLSAVELFINGYRVSYLLEDGGEYYLPFDELEEYEECHSENSIYYNVKWTTNKKAGSKIGKIKTKNATADPEEDLQLYEINKVTYVKLSEYCTNWVSEMTYSKKLKRFIYGRKLKSQEKPKKDAVYEFVKTAVKGCKTDKQRVRKLHDAIILRCEYNEAKNAKYRMKHSNLAMNESQLKAIRMLGAKAGVCEDYAYLFKQCCDRLFVPAKCRFGKGNSDYHMWNQVYLDKKWFNIDVTWDDPIGNRYKKASDIRSTYYLKSDYFFAGSHIWYDMDKVLPKFDKSWKKIKRNNIRSTNELRKSVIYASYLASKGKGKSYTFRIKGKNVQTGIYFVFYYEFVSGYCVDYSNGSLKVTFNTTSR